MKFAQKGVKILCTLNKILELLEKNNVKQKDLTDYLGISKNAFTNWKGGYSNSYTKYLPQIAEFFNVSIDYLVGRENKKSESTIIPYSGNERIDSIAKEILKTNLTEEDIKLIEFILDKYKK